MPTRQEPDFDLNQVGYRARLELGGANAATVQLSLLSAVTPSTFVVTLKRSNDGENWAALESAQTIAFGGFASARTVISNKIDCSGVGWIAAEVTTAEGSALIGRITMYASKTF